MPLPQDVLSIQHRGSSAHIQQQQQAEDNALDITDKEALEEFRMRTISGEEQAAACMHACMRGRGSAATC
jgi:hypothetical protein